VIEYGTDYPEQPWLDRDGQPITGDDMFSDEPPPDLDSAEPPPDVDDYHPGEYHSPNGDGPPPPADEAAAFENLVAHRTHILRINAEAKRRLEEEEHPPIQLPPVKSLDMLLAEPDTLALFRIADLAPIDSRIILSAQYKAGKTIIVDNVLRSLADGDPLLGRFEVNSPAARIVLIDDELSENMLRRWLREQGIVNTAAVVDVISLRGRVGAFNLLDERCRRDWAQRFADLGCEYLLLDCLRPVLDALGLDESHDAGKFLVQFDALLADAGISDSLLIHHMGHNSERARGDSRLEDWPDAIWRINREDPNDQTSARYFSAVGRDVNVPEGRLSFDADTRRLTYAAGSRSDAKAEAARASIIRLLASASDPAKAGDIDALNYPRNVIREVLAELIAKGVVDKKTGRSNAQLHTIAYPCAECGLPVLTREERHLSCPSRPEELTFD
jgi:AAA domain